MSALLRLLHGVLLVVLPPLLLLGGRARPGLAARVRHPGLLAWMWLAAACCALWLWAGPGLLALLAGSLWVLGHLVWGGRRQRGLTR